ncbi:acetyl-CoA carboxylase biotin carboxyl carrier protein [Nonomuraea diastatica]|uniref:Biotin carboxyl carrier protein of acetyl-CoA carboxylase n=1 Tax=Nonomuraea diastatica TaxID=1848329 RepID=A0A4R4VRN6_9ACTN|nr:biotin/lipoyl-containing protein [Nonomuraea diastatica]TDD08502.1 acetyl-CoA carboxylase, biotin carboxyl carrier protein [Nonomuraea diastatica]
MADHGELIETVQRHAAGFIDAIGGPIRRLKVTVGEVSLEAEWAAPADQDLPVDRHLSTAGGTAVNGRAADGAVVQGAARTAVTVTAAAHGTASASQGVAATVGTVIPSPMVGTFYRCPEPGAEPFVKEGDLVTAGQQVAILEAMKMMNPIHATTAGRITRALAEDAAAVEYGQALFALEES